MKKNTFSYSRSFDEEFEYKGTDLGVNCENKITTFKIWAPFADRVEVYLYESGNDRMELDKSSLPHDYFEVHEMTLGDKGVYFLRLEKDLHGIYYDYLIYTKGETVRSADPYARACSTNGCKSMVVDLSRTNPKGFKEDKAPKKSTENIIYELHIKDFSQDPQCGIKSEYRGKYKAFTVTDSTLNSEGEIPTCVNYLKSLGVTHVHLLPFFDFGNLDEEGEDSQFNWGYDPLNYNVPEGSYATDTKDGTTRIKECKEMIQSLHKAGIRVIMDVVYNHTHDVNSWLERTAPGYFYRRKADGNLSDGSACGNDIAVGRGMVDNYIINSVLYWAKEYHLDGFRFDLMGLLTTDIMNRIAESLDSEYGKGEKLLYGEPWRVADSPMEEGTIPALKDNIRELNESIAVFSDDTRDLIKGNVFFPKIPGFVNGGVGLEKKVLDAVGGWAFSKDGFAPKSVSQVVNYVSSHDNNTLWDKLLLTMKTDLEMKEKMVYKNPNPEVLKANKMAALMYFTFQGHIFFQAGEEFARTKFGDENSYRSHPNINMLRWEQVKDYEDLVDYYKGLIYLRKNLPGLYDKSKNAGERITNREICSKNIVSFMVDNTSENRKSEWKSLFVVYNGSDLYSCRPLPEGKWEILADANESNCRKKANKEIVVPAHSGVLLGRVD